MDNQTLLSFVIPCYRSEKTIERVIDEIVTTVTSRDGYDYEVIAVNDCSPDDVYRVLCEIAQNNKKVKIINLVKNMGKHAAILAGYSYVSGDYVINLDDDYQSPTNELWELLEPVENGGYDVSTASYVQKKESLWKRFGSNLNFAIEEAVLNKPKGIRYENFSILKRIIVDEIVKYKNPFPFLEGLVYRSTSKIISVPLEQRERADDKKTGFSLWKSISLFANGFTNFSVKPLRLALFIGVSFALMGFAFGIVIVIRKIHSDVTLVGWSSVMAVLLSSSGIIMLLLGVIGEYIGRIFICINESPQYIIRNTIGFEDSVERL